MREVAGGVALLGILTALALGILAVWSGDVRWFWTAVIVFVPSFLVLVGVSVDG